jgi:hypothetical protein
MEKRENKSKETGKPILISKPKFEEIKIDKPIKNLEV